jgi:hypothetical protein
MTSAVPKRTLIDNGIVARKDSIDNRILTGNLIPSIKMIIVYNCPVSTQ